MKIYIKLKKKKKKKKKENQYKKREKDEWKQALILTLIKLTSCTIQDVYIQITCTDHYS